VREKILVTFKPILNFPDEVNQLVQYEGARLVISISGGKDSDAMAEILNRYTFSPRQVHLVHADLGRAEWSMTNSYINRRAKELDLPLTVVQRPQGDLLQQMQDRMVKRPEVVPFPDAKNRYCASDQKRGQIDKFVRTLEGPVIVAMGLRAEESPARAKRPPFQKNERISTKARPVYDWLPIHHFSLADVWDTLGYAMNDVTVVRSTVQRLRQSGYSWEMAVKVTGWQWHPAYALGNQRLSCSICILGSKNDIMNGIEYQPDYYRELVKIENQSGFTFRKDLRLGDLRPDLLGDS
jgi:3'-phosphoadenosine 5'-phosphosulfate sulfotransferase (PAPS reductase)/FAD synthetase